MRSIVKVLVLLFIVNITSVIFPKQVSAQQPYVSLQVFYDQLSPYGEWVEYPNYGYVWIPDAGPDFVPYLTQGHWIFTDYGWTWMSDYSWGWAPFHYGRWDYDQYYGWLWIPGNEWGPAWVSWRRADGYYGWAPLEPGISLSLSFSRGYDSHNDHWIFVRDRDIDRDDIDHNYISRTDQDQIVRRSSVINNTYVDNSRHTTYIAGPARTDFQRATGRQVNPVQVQEYDKPGQEMNNGNFRIYRPEVAKSSGEKNPAPSRITNLKDVKQPSQRNATNQAGNLPEKSSQPLNANPSQNVRKEAQPNNIKPQNSNQPQNIRREAQPNNVKPQNSNPPQNIRKEAQPNNVKPQNSNPPQNIRREAQPNNVKPQNSNPPQNIKGEAQPNNVKTQTTNPPKNLNRQTQPNNVKKMNTNPSQKTVKEKKSNASKSTANDKKDKQKKSDNTDDIKKND